MFPKKEHVRPACLPLKKDINKDITGIEMIAAGWGKTNDCKFNFKYFLKDKF